MQLVLVILSLVLHSQDLQPATGSPLACRAVEDVTPRTVLIKAVYVFQTGLKENRNCEKERKPYNYKASSHTFTFWQHDTTILPKGNSGGIRP
jgi:hypothetical protein